MTILPEEGAPFCTSGKRPFRTRADAEHQLDRAAERRSAGDSDQRRPGEVEKAVYQCPGYQWWHLASRKRRTRRGDLANSKSTRRRRR